MKTFLLPYHRSIHRRLMRTILLPILLVCAVVALTVPLVIGGAIAASGSTAADEMSGALADALSGFRSAMEEVTQDARVRAFLRTGENRSQVFTRLYGMRNDQPVKAYFQLADLSGQHEARDMPAAMATVYDAGRDTMLQWKLKNARGAVEHVLSPGVQEASAPVFSLAAPIKDGEELLGYLTVILTREALGQILSLRRGGVILASAAGRPFLNLGTPLTLGYERFEPKRLIGPVYKYEGSLFLCSLRHPKGTDILLYSLYQIDYMLPLMGLELALLAALSLLTWLVIRNVTYQLTTVPMMAPFDRLFLTLQEYRRGRALRQVTLGEDWETDVYLAQFNTVLEEIDSLLKLNGALQEENRVAEYRALQSQFNPHFLFNMLDTIRYMAREDPEETERMILSLARMLRYTLDDAAAFAPLHRDMAYVEEYLRLQRVRMGPSLTYAIQMDPAAKGCQVPKLILQPLVENSIRHGFAAGQPLHIDIRAALEGDQLRIVASDNGQGMSPQRLAALRESIALGRGGSAHIGVINTHKRLQLLYGTDFGLIMESQQGKGTWATLLMKFAPGEEA